MKKCIGCGEILQNLNKDSKGYILDLKHDYCFRCFKMKHYNELKLDLKYDISKKDVFELIKNIDATFVLIVDVLNIESSFDQELLDFLSDKKVILIISKCDLLPKAINFDSFEKNVIDYLAKIFKGINVLEVILSSKNDCNFKVLFETIVKEFELDKLCFIGYSNVGKSSLINRLLDSEILTTSYFLTTTLNLNEIELGGYKIIDTPGFVDFNNAYAVLNPEKIKKIVIKKTIKPKVFQLYENQSYFVEDIFRVDTLTEKSSSIVFYLNNDLNIHRTNYLNADKYMGKHCVDLNGIDVEKIVFNVNNNDELVIDGIGFIKLYNIKKIIITINKNIKAYIRKGII